ncbi:MAG: hypothetical protein LBW85_03820 [Deltaproteobacteria bacterium]|nr:hypothetical protein [Deltaproteobacteria bacterium]
MTEKEKASAAALTGPEAGGGNGGQRLLFGMEPGTVRLLAVSVLVAVVLSGSESVHDGMRNVYTAELFNHLTLTQSAAEAMIAGEIPPRVSPFLTGGLGNPYHQFYAPLAHMTAAAASVLLGDLMIGYSATVIFLMAFAFFFMYRLGLYLTGSPACAALAAFVYATAPYLSIDRNMRGAYTEYFALCLLPAALYWNLRALPLRSFRSWALAALFTGALFLSHFITGFFFLFFYALFFLVSGATLLARDLVAGFAAGKAPVFEAAGPEVSGAVRDTEEIGTESSGDAAGGGDESLAEAGGGIAGSAFRRVSSDRLAGRRRRRAFLRKALCAASVALAALLLCAYQLGPLLLYGDTVLKTAVLPGIRTAASAAMTQLLTVLSLTDIPWNWKDQFLTHARFQAGLVVFASHAAFAWYCAARKSAWALPFSLISWIIFLLTVWPQAFSFPPLKYIDIAQYSYRFLGFFALAGAVAGGLALRGFFRSVEGFTRPVRACAALAIICLALVLSSPYLFPRPGTGRSPRTANMGYVLQTAGLDYGEDYFLRPRPQEGSFAWTEPERAALKGAGKPSDMAFRADLGEYYRTSGGPPGEALLDILYYPGLQEVTVKAFSGGAEAGAADGNPAFETFWQKREAVKGAVEDGPGAFHGLRITGLPDEGLLEARIKFIGMRWANRVSFASCLLLAVAAIFLGLRGAGRKAGGALPKEPQNGHEEQVPAAP